MDNLGSHKASAVRRAIRAAGARLFYLPKYSPGTCWHFVTCEREE
jgi:transposase